MSRKGRENKYFHIGKNRPKNDNKLTPLKGEPNTNLDTYHKESGKLHSRRKFGQDGSAVKDMDVADKHRPADHAHDFDGAVRSKSARPLTKKERKEMEKAKKKRRFWK